MEEKTNKTFPDGLMWFKPREGAPEFVKGTLSVSPGRLIAWMRENRNLVNARGYFALDLKKSRGGKLYFQANTFKPKPQEETRDSFSEPVIEVPPPEEPRDFESAFEDKPFRPVNEPESDPEAIPW